MTYDAGAAGYSPSRGLMANLHIDRLVRQMGAALTELNKYVAAASEQTVSSSIRGLLPPAPPSNPLFALGAGDDDTERSGEPNRKQSHPMQEFAIRSAMLSGVRCRLNLWLDLRLSTSFKIVIECAGTILTARDSMQALDHRLRSVSIAGTSSEEQNILIVLSRYYGKLRRILFL